MSRLYTIYFFFFIPLLSICQQSQPDLQLQTGMYASNGAVIPFWLQANRFGAVPASGSALVFSVDIQSKKDSSSPLSQLIYGANLFVSTGKSSRILLPELYAGYQFKGWQLTVGRERRVLGLVDSTLSSGSISWSGNSLPLPAITVSRPHFTNLLFPWLSWKASFSHGWFGEQRFASSYYLHQKSLYGRLGRESSKVKLYGGILHHVQWGGFPTRERDQNGNPIPSTPFSSDFRTYVLAIYPSKKLTQKMEGYSPFDTENRFGNHLGQLDMAASLQLKNSTILGYKQTFFETGATFSSLSNVDDGLYGIRWKSSNPTSLWQHVTFEYLQTTNQGSYQPALARLFGLQDRHFGENNFYFNHQQYYDGWSYQRQTIGTPFLLAEEQIRSQKFGGNGFIFTNNNRVKVGYLAMQHRFNSIDIISKLSYSRNFGSYLRVLEPVSQLSTAIQMQYDRPQTRQRWALSIGLDHGDLIKDTYGIALSFIQKWE
ncbi:MAG: capsule assembly Wzi family protein [Spirosomataceae bacterium]